MKQITQLTEYIQEQLCDAHKYAQKAIQYKDSNHQLSKMYHALSKQQINHAQRQHEFVGTMIAQMLDMLK